MYEINMQKENQFSYMYKAKNSKNQLLTLNVYQSVDDNWNVMFFITSKRKHGYQKLKQTGKDGVQSLIWAKNCVLDWIKNVQERRFQSGPIKLFVYADDKRRMKVYKRALIPLGFQVEKSAQAPLFITL